MLLSLSGNFESNLTCFVAIILLIESTMRLICIMLRDSSCRAVIWTVARSGTVTRERPDEQN